MANDLIKDALECRGAIAAYLASETKPLLLFKQGQFTAGGADKVVPLGTRFRTKPRQHQIGWTRWCDNRPVENRMGMLWQGYTAPDRYSLGLLDQNDWETDKLGNKRDPWVMNELMPFIDDRGAEFLFSTGTYGGRHALIELEKTFQRDGATRDPVVEIDSEQHRNQHGGINPRPKFNVVGWLTDEVTPPASPPPLPLTTSEKIGGDLIDDRSATPVKRSSRKADEFSGAW